MKTYDTILISEHNANKITARLVRLKTSGFFSLKKPIKPKNEKKIIFPIPRKVQIFFLGLKFLYLM